MKKINFNRKERREVRHKRSLSKYNSTNNGLPRLVITKSNSHIFAQLVDTHKNITILSSSSLQLKLKNGNVKNAKIVGKDIAKKILAKKIKNIYFDCNGFKYHGRISALADSAREEGLKF